MQKFKNVAVVQVMETRRLSKNPKLARIPMEWPKSGEMKTTVVGMSIVAFVGSR